MRFHFTIKRKLLLLLLSSIALVLTLTGAAFDLLIRRFHEEKAHERFTEIFQEAPLALTHVEEKLLARMEYLSTRNEVVTTVSNIYRNARPDNYRTPKFDSEKRILARLFAEEARSSGIGQFAVYDAGGGLLAFHREREPGAAGYVSFEKGLPVYYLSTLGAPWERNALPETIAAERKNNGTRSRSAVYRQDVDGIRIEVAAPVIRDFGSGKSQYVGQVVGVQFLGSEFVQSLGDHGELEVALLFDDGSHFGGLPGIGITEAIRAAPTLDAGKSGVHSHVQNDKYFMAAVRVPLTGGLTAYLVTGFANEVVEQDISRTQQMMLFLLVLSALLIMPAGAALARRTILHPVEQLVRSVDALRKGEYGHRAQVSSGDEIGSLAAAFNEMADTIERRQQALAKSENKYRNLVENLPQRVFYKNRDSVYISVNQRFASDLGISPEEAAGRTDYDFFPTDLAAEYREGDRRVIDAGHIVEFEERYLKGKSERYVHTVKTPLRDESGEVIGVLGIFWDITERRQNEDRLRQSAAVFESTAEGVMITDADARIIAVNKAFTEITGYSAEEALGQTPKLLGSDRHDAAFFKTMYDGILRAGRWQGEIWNRRKSGEVHPEWMTISVVHDAAGRLLNYVAVFSDITAIKHSQELLDHLAHHDPLTDLPNRLLFSARLNHAIENARRKQREVAVLFLDLDRFKNVNDTLGHPVGDQLLQRVAVRLREHLRGCDTVARLGGDEFIVTVDSFEHMGEVISVAQKLLKIFEAPFALADNELYLGASIGIAVFPKDGADVATLVKNADAAMYLAKEQGRNTYRFYTTQLSAEAEAKFRLEIGLRHAVESGELELYFQPQVDMETGRMLGTEALLRWNHPELGLVMPDRFIPLAEETGFILPIGEWVLREACSKFADWQRRGSALQQISVNLSGIQVQRGNLVATVQKTLIETGLDARCLELEITESVIMKYPERATVILDGLQELGVELAIDDFGTGYSSLSYLKRYPLDNLKIDKSFVHDIPQDASAAAIVRAVISLGENLQLRVTAEGVETENQRLFLLQHGCKIGQGWLFGRAVPVAEFEASLGIAGAPEVQALTQSK